MALLVSLQREMEALLSPPLSVVVSQSPSPTCFPALRWLSQGCGLHASGCPWLYPGGRGQLGVTTLRSGQAGGLPVPQGDCQHLTAPSLGHL